MVKQKKFEEEKLLNSIKPLKQVYEQELIERLKSGEKIDAPSLPTENK